MAGSVGKKASALVASDPDKKRLAEKSFTSYVRAVQLMPNKQVSSFEVLTYNRVLKRMWSYAYADRRFRWPKN